MPRIVIMQPYYMAWYGFFEQIKLADIYVFYDDVQYVKRSLMNRVSIIAADGSKWLTVPLSKVHQGDLICNVVCHEESDWRSNHLNQLSAAYRNAPFLSEMYSLATDILRNSGSHLAEVTILGIKEICRYLKINENVSFFLSSDLKIPGSSTARLVNIAKELGADKYLTGLGALNYLDYDLFEKNNIQVEFINYAKAEYPQNSLLFNPYVSILDLIAYTGEKGMEYFKSVPINYKDFVSSMTARSYLERKSKAGQ